MNFLEEVLVSKGLVEVEELNDKIQEINKNVLQLKEEVTATMEEKYINYTCALENTTLLLNKMRSLSNEVDLVHERIENQLKNELSASKCELESLAQALKETTLCYHLVNRLLKINTALEAASGVKPNDKFLEIAQQLKEAEEDLKNTSGFEENLEIFDALKSELQFWQSKHSYNITKLWEQCLVWNESEINKSSRIVSLTLATNLDKEEVFKTMFFYDIMSFEMKYFSEKFLKDLLIPIISNATRVNIEHSVLTVKVSLRPKVPPCMDVLTNLTIVFNFLSLQLCFNATSDVSFMSELKSHIGDEFCRYLIQNCLSLSVPKKREELEAYGALVEEIKAFEVLLKELGFMAEDDESIAEYSTNVEELFANKTCESYLAAARNIMKKDLHDVKQVGPVESSPPPDLEASTVQLSELSPHTFQFPSCQISKSTEELMDLVWEVLREIPQNTDKCAVRLFYTARSIFTLYCDVVPEFHSKLLDTIPQQSAILHNNAMYLAHQLVSLGAMCRPSLPPVLQSHTSTFIDLVDSLRGLAISVFTKQMLMQKKHMIDILRDSGLVTLSDSPKFPPGVEKAIRQCLRQLALLQTVWQNVLPVNNYCKVLGSLCNVFVEEVIQKVLAAEDLPSDTAAQLVVIFSLIQQKAPQVFPEPLEIHRHVKKWAKFGELQFLLGAGLREVDDRWADGKGPLAQEFTAEQVRHLVRALFQISDRRAVLLAKII